MTNFRLPFLPLVLITTAAISCAVKAEIGVGVSYVKQETEVVLDDSTEAVTFGVTALQLSYSVDDWLFGISTNFSDNNQEWPITSNRSHRVDMAQSSQELFAKYYLNDWSLNLSAGHSDSNFNQSLVRYLPNKNIPLLNVIAEETYDTNEQFYEVGLDYWKNLDHWVEELALVIGVFATHYQITSDSVTSSRIVQVSNSTRVEQFIEQQGIVLGVQNESVTAANEALWHFGLSADWSYPLELFSQEFLASAWQGLEYSDDSNGVLTTSRIVHGQRRWQRQFALDDIELQQSAKTYYSYGFDLDWYLNSQLSIAVSTTKLEDSPMLWQLSAFYLF